VSFVYAKNTGIAQRAEMVIFLSPIPNNQVIKDKPNLLELLRQVGVKRIEFISFTNIHDHDAAIGPRFKQHKSFRENRLQRGEKLPIVGNFPQIGAGFAIIPLRFTVGASFLQKNIPIGGRGNNQVNRIGSRKGGNFLSIALKELYFFFNLQDFCPAARDFKLGEREFNPQALSP
jgi:hypothetical protein